MRVVAGIHPHHTRSGAIGSAGLVVRARSFLGAKLLHWANLYWSFWQQSKELRQLGTHLADVPGVFRNDLLGRGCKHLGIILQRSSKSFEIVGSELFCNGKLLAFDACDFFQTKLVNDLRIHAGCGPKFDVVTVEPIAVRKRPDAKVGATLGHVIRSEKVGQLRVRRPDLIVHGCENSIVKALAISLRNAVRKLGDRLAKRTRFSSWRCQVLTLFNGLLQQVARRHQLVFFTLLQDAGDLLEDLG